MKRVQFPDPEPIRPGYHHVDNPSGWWLILCDVHVPYHDRMVLERAVSEARKLRVRGVVLNGDIMDSHEVSDHDRDPRAVRYVEEVRRTRQLLAWLRQQLPDTRLLYKLGNHEERLQRYIIQRAPALEGLEGLTLPDLLQFDNYGIESVADRAVIQLGHLNIIHGHEYGRSVTAPVNPARGVYLRARGPVLVGHWHRTSEHHERDIRGRVAAAWSVGCACSLYPYYQPLTNWNHGYAVVHVESDGRFSVSNRKVIDGMVV